MVVSIGTTFPSNWQYGPEEITIFRSTSKQVDQSFPGQRNLVINTTWFGSQFSNRSWQEAIDLIAHKQEFDNLFLLAVIDPMYLTPQDQQYLVDNLKIKQVYKIGMFADSEYEWNFHAVAVDQLCPDYSADQLLMTVPQQVFLLYQRKPRTHRIELTNILVENNYAQHGIVTLGATPEDSQYWGEGLRAPILTIEDSPQNYKHNGSTTSFSGIPNDLASLGRLDVWQTSFLNIVSETEFNDWHPRFVTEKTWKPIIGLRPFIIHGQRSVYSWLRKNGFRTFNNYWSHIAVESSPDQHGNVVSVIDFLCSQSKQELQAMYQDMLPDLHYNKQRYREFAQEQKYKIDHLFHARQA